MGPRSIHKLIAPAGQVSTQTPQSTQESGLTFALPLSMLIALLGHSCVQDSQPVHLPLSTCAGIQVTLSKEQLLVNTLGEPGIIPRRPAISTKFHKFDHRPHTPPFRTEPGIHFHRSVRDQGGQVRGWRLAKGGRDCSTAAVSQVLLPQAGRGAAPRPCRGRTRSGRSGRTSR